MPARGQPCAHSCGERIMNIFYIIGVVVVVALVLSYLGLA
jgi:hypothetical protein